MSKRKEREGRREGGRKRETDRQIGIGMADVLQHGPTCNKKEIKTRS